MTPERSQRAPARALVCSASLLAGFFGFGFVLLSLLDYSGQRYGRVELDVVTPLRALLENQKSYVGPPRLVYLGDSLSMPDRHGNAAPEELFRLRKLRGGSTDNRSVLNVSTTGLTVFSHYLASEQLAALEADRFIIAVNLGWFSRGRVLQQPKLAGMLPVHRWPEAARLPLHEIGLSAETVMTAHALMATGWAETWRQLEREQVRFGYAVDRAGAAVQETLGHPEGGAYKNEVSAHRRVRRTTGRHRPTAIGALERWGPILRGLSADDPNLQVLAALIARLRRTGARVLVLVPPTNVEMLNQLGLYDADAFSESLAQIREVATGNDSDFLDLHALLPDAAFRDAKDHLDLGAPLRPQSHVAAQLVLWSEGEDDWDLFLPEQPPPGETMFRTEH